MLEAIIRVLAPHYCLSCKKEDTLLCDGCRNAELRLVSSRCYQCKKFTNNHAVCQSCRRYGPLKCAWVGCEYTELPRQLIRSLKFARARSGYQSIVCQLDDIVPLIEAAVVPIPTATHRVRQRGYDQASLIAKAFARRRSLPYSELLQRCTQTRQVGATRAERLQQAETFFTVKSEPSMPEKVLLIDDVVTTGATLQAAARQLKTAGVKDIYAAVFTQKQ